MSEAESPGGTRPGGGNLEQDRIVESLIPDPSQGPPNATVLHGYLGKGTGPGLWRLYLTANLDRYVEIPEDQILHSQKLPDDGGTLIWLPKSTPVDVVQAQSRKVQAEFLTGSIARARLPGASAAAGVTAGLPGGLPGPSLQLVRCPSAVDACASRLCPPSVREICIPPSEVRRCMTFERVVCPTFGFVCPSIHVECPSEIRCPSLADSCPSELVCDLGGGVVVDPRL